MRFSQAVFIAVLVAGAECLAVSQPTAARLDKRGSWTSLGCYSDNVSSRALPNGESVPGGAGAMTNELCHSACQNAGYTYAGTEYAGECWCGNAIVNGGAPASSGCNMACNGDASETCGGSNRLTVYQYSSSGDSGGSSPSSTAKRGLAYNNNDPAGNAEYANLFVGYPKISWGYDWGFPSWNLSSTFDVPMLWGLPSGNDPSWTAAVQQPGTKYILGFNEPDLTYSGSANILPAAAAAGYKQYMEPFASQVRISLPNVLWNNFGSSSGGQYDSRQWMQYFLGNCTGCHFDFAPIHWYQDCNPSDGESGASWFMSNVTSAHDVLGLPVWVTEFECYGTDAQQVAFLQEVLPWLDQQSYVERYSYFGVFPNYLVNSGGTAPSDIGTAFAET